MDGDQDFQETRSEIQRGTPRARRKALRRLRRFGDDPRAVDLLVEVLAGSDQALRPKAARLLGESKSPEGVPVLAGVLENATDEPNEDVPPQAAWALGEIGDQRAVPALVSLLANRDDDDFLFMAHREALYALADLGHLEPIEEFIADPTRPEEIRDEATRHILPRGERVRDVPGRTSDRGEG